MAEAISLTNPPKIEYVFNNAGGKDLRCLDYQYYIKVWEKRLQALDVQEKGVMQALA